MSRKHTHGTPGSVRIIAGAWRGSKLPVVDVPGLRPTSDRARETLFNWLAPWVPGATCVDLYAGSGALGFEAASRDAAEVIMVEADTVACRSLDETRHRLRADCVSIASERVESFLVSTRQRFDIAFLDPPFEKVSAEQIQGELVPALEAVLKPNGWLYVEQPRAAETLEMSSNWCLTKQKTLGEVQISLFRGSE